MDVARREHVDEETFDDAMGELLTVPLEELRLKEIHWEKFDRPCPPSNGYVYAVQLLGNIKGKRILDLGCGDGSLLVILAKRGATVWGFDTSSVSIEVA